MSFEGLFQALDYTPPPEEGEVAEEAFEAMEDEALAVEGNDSGVSSCSVPYVEVWLTDGDGKAIGGVPLTSEPGGGKDGTLDDLGYVKLGGYTVPDSEAEQMYAMVSEDENGSRTLQVKTGTPPKDEDEEPEPEVTDEPEAYVQPAMDPP